MTLLAMKRSGTVTADLSAAAASSQAAKGTGGIVEAIHPVPPVTLTLPMPPSVNEMYANRPGKGRVLSEVYRDWKGHAGWVLKSQKPACIGGPILIVLSVERGSSQADIDNRVKALFDLLVTHKVIDDDRHVVGFCVAWAPAASKLARVMVLPADNYSFDFRLAKDRATGGWFMHGATTEEEPNGT